MARRTPLMWIKEQGGWSSAKLLLDTYGHYMPTESAGFSDVLTASDGPRTAPTQNGEAEGDRGGHQSVMKSMGYGDGDIKLTPRSPIMHIGDPPPAWST
jgi:hypothetical protein